MDEGDIALRNATYGLLVREGRAPTARETAAATGLSVADVDAGWRRLHEAHALVLDEGGAIRMAHPFSAVPTPYRVHAAGRSWYANCGWDALGVCVALHAPGRVEASCPDCGEAIGFDVRDGVCSDPTLLFHCLVPAAQWWDDVAFT